MVAVVLQAESVHAKRVRELAEESGRLINATSGHKTRSVIILESNQVVLCALKTTTVNERVWKGQGKVIDQS
jgi:regulator of extracellular matrix RemA (YlzA/DUF370 family)